MIQKRFIRLKEPVPGSDSVIAPKEEYIVKTNGTLIAQEYRTRVDIDGAIETGNQSTDPKTTEHLILLGDSFVESSFVKEEERFASQLERMFHHGLVVKNFSYSGTTSLQILHLFLAKVAGKFSPGCSRVCFFLPTSDVDALELEGGLWNETVRYSPIVPSSGKWLTATIRSIDQMYPVLMTFIDTCRNFGFKLTVVNTPFMLLGEPKAVSFLEGYFGSSKRAQRVVQARKQHGYLMRDLCERRGIDFLDLHASLGGHHDLFYDDRHLNALGSRVVAESLYQDLKGD